MSRQSKESLIAFVMGWLLGRSRRGSGMSILLLLAGALSCFMALPTIAFGLAFGWIRAREVASLAQPGPEGLDALLPGTQQVLVLAQIPPDAAPGPHGLALY
jgi:hypothetical protein